MAFISVALKLAVTSISLYCQDASAFVSPSSTSFFSGIAYQQQQHKSGQCIASPLHQQQCRRSNRQCQLFSTMDTDLTEEVKSMRVAAIKQELESYGISTKTFLEKSELVDALVQARKEGKTPISTASSASASSSSSSSSSSSTTSTSSTNASTTSTTTTTTTRIAVCIHVQLSTGHSRVQRQASTAAAAAAAGTDGRGRGTGAHATGIPANDAASTGTAKEDAAVSESAAAEATTRAQRRQP
mmetsp:Transcript_1488/g.2888  ORF Transcript_1488/g.2888 Transcript_1488/m.2888 type:complete len:243 (-) Transcript_1488:2117-2845(-)